MDGFDINLEPGWSLDLDRIIQSNKLLSITKLLAMELKENGYLSVADFIQGLSNDDLQMLSRSFEDTTENEEEVDCAIITEMLVVGEGLEVSNDVETFSRRINTVMGFLVIESLKRKGFVKVYYENMSLGEDMGDKIVVERIDDETK